jgi:hypothetical protein
MYKLIKIDGVLQNTVKRLADNAFIPMSKDNSDYQAYLEWVSQGNQPEPADE